MKKYSEMARNTKYPEHAYSSFREFRQEKYADAKAALKAIDALRNGCAYTPAREEILAAAKLIESARLKMRASEWK